MLKRPYALSTALSTILLLLPAICSSANTPQISVCAPESAGIGQPFLIQISSPQTIDQLLIRWNGKTVIPSISVNNGTSQAMVLLGSRLSSKPEDIPLIVDTTIHGTKHEFQKTIHIVPHKYQEEKLSVAPKMITPPEKKMMRIKAEREKALKAIRTVSAERRWTVPFALPVKGKKLSRFGLYRTFNGEIKRRHKGLDFRAWLGTPIKAIAAGKVVLIGNFYYAGNCVFIDHGNGVVSNSIHMSKVLVKEGDLVKPGQKIGLSGATGRATGAHLHLSVYVQGVSIDPEPLFTLGSI
ncbi:M23 family metallopeptidase [Maridesulfovibrio sp.]|uniref:M23 family metallopeptidase n=1 Tax=Maridesulfovibrio sp. TaxID=2795000 RepID=UPI002AA61FE6|nr:M23 family metallopeptidase [Maridesulfovibrio sp.]